MTMLTHSLPSKKIIPITLISWLELPYHYYFLLNKAIPRYGTLFDNVATVLNATINILTQSLL